MISSRYNEQIAFRAFTFCDKLIYKKNGIRFPIGEQI